MTTVIRHRIGIVVEERQSYYVYIYTVHIYIYTVTNDQCPVTNHVDDELMACLPEVEDIPSVTEDTTSRRSLACEDDSLSETHDHEGGEGDFFDELRDWITYMMARPMWCRAVGEGGFVIYEEAIREVRRKVVGMVRV